jgi:MOSC domain-containing protein YiiM
MEDRVLVSGKLLGIAIAPKRHQTMECISCALVSSEFGVAGDSRGTRRKRQVTVLFEDDWSAACDQAGARLDWTSRRANLFVRGISGQQKKGYIISINDVILRVNGVTDPCAIMDGVKTGLRGALDINWRGGVCCTVMNNGIISVGNVVTVQK